MFAKPTIDDFLARIDWHINQADGRAKRAVNDVRRKASAAGTLNSGNTIVRCFEVARSEFNSGVEAVLGELKRTVQKTNLDRDQLRGHAVERLMSFATMAKATAKTQEAARSSGYVAEQYADLDQHINFLVRQFDVGFFDPVEPEIPPVANNSITVGNMTGNIAQGSPGANQEFNLNIGAAEKALATFEAALASVPPSTTLDELMADVKTIKAQLAKPSPNRVIVQEAGKSLRNVVEGIGGGLLTPTVQTTAAALWGLLGLG